MHASVENAPLIAKQAVEHFIGKKIARAKALHAYQTTPTSRAEYKGCPSGRNAEMVVDVKYEAFGSRDVTIRLATWSKPSIDKVFQKRCFSSSGNCWRAVQAIH